MSAVRDPRRPQPAGLADARGTTASITGLSLVLRQVEHRLEQLMAADLAEVGLVTERWRILTVLLASPGQTMSELAASAVLPAASLTRHMDRLVEQGLVVRRIHSEDRRRVAAALSPLGHRVCGRLREREREREQKVRALIGHERFDALVEDLRLLPFALD